MFPAADSGEEDPEKPIPPPALAAQLSDTDAVDDVARLMSILTQIFDIRAENGLETPETKERPPIKDFSNCTPATIAAAENLSAQIEDGI